VTNFNCRLPSLGLLPDLPFCLEVQTENVGRTKCHQTASLGCFAGIRGVCLEGPGRMGKEHGLPSFKMGMQQMCFLTVLLV